MEERDVTRSDKFRYGFLIEVKMILGVVSDTHGHQVNTQNAVRMLEAFDVEVVIHCGDIGSVYIPPLFEKWPTHYVFGNVDGNQDELRDAIEAIGHHCHGLFGSLELADRSIAFLHGHDHQLFRETVRSDEWDLVCYGHTHIAEIEQVGNTRVLNPGAVFRARPHSVAVVELSSLEITNVPF
ncbi:MAG: putative phosphoesterase [Pirellulaceae bacterium]|jgi:putative phosphoesterase